jgi:hypothetical protein
MDTQRFTKELISHLRERPYATLAALVGVGWVLGRAVPLRAVLAMAGVGARTAMTVALEDVARPRTRSRGEEASI